MNIHNQEIDLIHGFSWLALVLSPWALLGLLASLMTGFNHPWLAGLSGLVCMMAVPQLIPEARNTRQLQTADAAHSPAGHREASIF